MSLLDTPDDCQRLMNETIANWILNTLRRQIIGADAPVTTPFGERLMVYADYTASGRCLDLVEKYLQNLQRIYANTHTEDDISGRSMTQLLEAGRTFHQKIRQCRPGWPDHLCRHRRNRRDRQAATDSLAWHCRPRPGRT